MNKMNIEFRSNLTIDNLPLEKSFVFSGGEVQIRLPEIFVNGYESQEAKNKTITIKTILNSANAIMELILVRKALEHYCPDNAIDLICWYLPYMRQDRICSPGECNSAEEFLEILSNLNFRSIFTADLHSRKGFSGWLEFTNTLYNFKSPITGLFEIDTLSILKENYGIYIFKHKYDILVAPDKGSVEKVRKISEYYGIPYIIGNKIRNPNTGYITDYDLDYNSIESLRDKSLLVIDDICDGGMTFILLINKLKIDNPMIVDLYVTHGIFSKDTGCLYDAGYDHIITTNSLFDNERKKEYHSELDDKFIVLNLDRLIKQTI